MIAPFLSGTNPFDGRDNNQMDEFSFPSLGPTGGRRSSMHQTNRSEYLHGSSKSERDRLSAQGDLFEKYIHSNLNFADVKNLLEIGSGSGVQTIRLLEKYPDLNIICVEIDPAQIHAARKAIQSKGFTDRVRFVESDAQNLLRIDPDICDAAFVCFALEHMSHPRLALEHIDRLLAPGSRVVFREVFNASFYTSAACGFAQDYWTSMAQAQKYSGGDPDMGIKLGSVLKDLGFEVLKDKTRSIKADPHEPELLNHLIDFWIGLMESAEPVLLQGKWIETDDLGKVIKELDSFRTNPEAVFSISYQEVQARTAN